MRLNAGWTVWNSVKEGPCDQKTGVWTYYPKVETYHLIRHVATYTKCNQNMARKVPRNWNTLTMESAALAIAVNMPFSFCLDRPVFAHFCSFLLRSDKCIRLWLLLTSMIFPFREWRMEEGAVTGTKRAAKLSIYKYTEDSRRWGRCKRWRHHDWRIWRQMFWLYCALN